SYQTSIVGSWGVFGYATIYGYAGMGWHKGALHAAKENSQAIYFDLNGTESDFYERRWSSTLHGVGMRLLILPPFFSLIAEWQYTQDNQSTVIAKIAINS